MGKLRYKLIREGITEGQIMPLNLVFVDFNDVIEAGLNCRNAAEIIGAQFSDPTAINIIDLDAVTTTSDGLMTEGAIVAMAASDHEKINPEFGYLEMMEVPYSKKRIEEEPHLKQWDIVYPGKRLIMGPKKKNLPIHCAAMTGRACNNNSGTEVWSIATMEELLMPILGQIEIVKGGDVMIGKTGEVISVGIGMVVGEEFARIIPGRAFHCGQTAHKSGDKAKNLKSHIPIIAAGKKTLAKYVIQALKAGMVPGRHIGPSPAVLSVAKLMNSPIDMDNIEQSAFDELASVGFTKEWIMEKVEKVSEEFILENADNIIPGGDGCKTLSSDDISEERFAVY